MDDEIDGVFAPGIHPRVTHGIPSHLIGNMAPFSGSQKEPKVPGIAGTFRPAPIVTFRFSSGE